MWAGISGAYPGMTLNGITIPLNYDPLVQIGWNYPTIIHPDFMGTLGVDGYAEITLDLKIDSTIMGLTLYFSYIVLSQGGGMPILAASNHVNATVTMFY